MIAVDQPSAVPTEAESREPRTDPWRVLRPPLSSNRGEVAELKLRPVVCAWPR